MCQLVEEIRVPSRSVHCIVAKSLAWIDSWETLAGMRAYHWSRVVLSPKAISRSETSRS